MAKVKVFNDNIHPFKSTFKGEDVLIASKDYWRDKRGEVKEMDIFEANDFKGAYHNPVPDSSGAQDPKSYKMIKLEPLTTATAHEAPEIETFTCMQCKHASPSPEELEAHISVRHPNSARLSMPEVDAEMPTPKRGRPPKERATA